jgi:hypothetical protein
MQFNIIKFTYCVRLFGFFNVVSRDDDSRSMLSAQTHQVIPDAVQFKRILF